jgi:hypothetical protein
MLRSTKPSFSGLTENLRYLPLFSQFNSVVEVLKGPSQVLGQNLAHGAFAGAHESDQDHSSHLGQKTGHIRPSQALQTSAIRPTSRTPPCSPLGFLYWLSARFLR